MKKYEYDITTHTIESFNQVAIFCSADGACNMESVPMDHTRALIELLNKRGELGWELLQMQFGKDGMLAFWKRQIPVQ